MMDNTRISNFFSLAETKIKLTKQAIRYYGKEVAPNFNSFDFWQINENKVSQILAFFLDPNQKHEQGAIYLKHFFKKLEIDFFSFDENDKIKVQCEYRTDQNRRIDIIIIKNDFEKVIGIENKIYIWTTDQYNQLTDYLEFLDKKTKTNDFCLIYLSPQDKIASEKSINIEDKKKYEANLKFITYEDFMIDCLHDFGNLTQNLRVKSFLKDFEKTLIRMYMGEENMDITQTVLDLITENPTNLEISLLVANAIQEAKQQLKQTFKQQIQEIGQELGMKVDGLYLIPSNWKQNKIWINYEMKGIIYGIFRANKDEKKTGASEINDLFVGQDFKVSEWWMMWRFLYENIENDNKFWIDIKNGQAKKTVKEFVEQIHQNFNTDQY